MDLESDSVFRVPEGLQYPKISFDVVIFSQMVSFGAGPLIEQRISK